MDQSIDRGRRPEFPERPRHVLVSLVPIGKGQRQKRRQMIVGESELEAHDQRELHVNGIAASYGVPQKVEAQPRAVGNPELPKELVGWRRLTATWHQHKNKFLLPTGFRQPDHTAAIGDTLMHELHAAVLTVKGYRGIKVTHMEGQMCQHRTHAYRLLTRSARTCGNGHTLLLSVLGSATALYNKAPHSH